MKRFLALLIVLFLLQALLPAARGLSFIRMNPTPSSQVKVASTKYSKTNVELANATKEISAKSIDIPSNDVDLSVQDYTKNIKTNDVTNAFKQSIESNTLSQSGGSYWAKTFGGSGNDTARSIQQTSDGGYIIAGMTDSFGAGDGDALIIKLNTKGNIQWAKTFGGNQNDTVSSIQQTSDGGYIIAGGTAPRGKFVYNCLVIKLTSNGKLSWAKTFSGSTKGLIKSISQTPDGGYILAGETAPYGGYIDDFLVLKLTSNGNISWAKTYGCGESYGSYLDAAYSIQQTSDGGYIISGVTAFTVSGKQNFLVIKITSNGNIQWAKTYGGNEVDDYAYISQTSDGGYIIAGYTQSFGAGNYDFLVIKLTSNGNLSWAKTFGGSKNDVYPSISQTSDGGYVVAGWTASFGAGNEGFLVLKLDSNGNIPGGSCNYLKDVASILTVKSVTPSVSDVDPAVKTCTPSVSSPKLSISSPELSVSTICKGTSQHNGPTTLILKPGNPYLTVNGKQQEIDPGRGTKPVIIPKWGRTVVPIRAIVEALGGTIGWNGKERKVTINFNGTVIELWIDKPQAKVNGKMKWIDPNNHDVRPIIINDRTMLPLRFVAESLGCKVDWNASTKTITITYAP